MYVFEIVRSPVSSLISDLQLTVMHGSKIVGF